MAKKQKSKLRQEAEGRQCQVRYIGICNGDRKTVVLAHPNEKSVFGVGTGQKPNDIFGAHCCSACHDAYDGRVNHGMSRGNLLVEFYQGIFRTMSILLDEGKIKTSQ